MPNKIEPSEYVVPFMKTIISAGAWKSSRRADRDKQEDKHWDVMRES